MLLWRFPQMTSLILFGDVNLPPLVCTLFSIPSLCHPKTALPPSDLCVSDRHLIMDCSSLTETQPQQNWSAIQLCHAYTRILLGQLSSCSFSHSTQPCGNHGQPLVFFLSHCFLLFNTRNSSPFLFTQANQVLVQSHVILRLDYCDSLLASLPPCTIQHLQLIQNAAARFIFNLPMFSHRIPLLCFLYWLSFSCLHQIQNTASQQS